MHFSRFWLLGIVLLAGCKEKEGEFGLSPSCLDSEYTQAVSTPNIRIIVPNGISPNGDRLNDNFVLFGTYITPPSGGPASPIFTTQTLRVYRGSGRELVFSSTNYSNEFDGHDSLGRELPEGDYFYQATLDTNTVQGTVRLARTSQFCNCRVIDPNDPNLGNVCP